MSRRLKPRELSANNQELIDQWFSKSEIIVRSITNTLKRRNLVKRLLYTWKDYFIKTMRDIRSTDLIHYSIDLTSNAKSMY